MTTTLDEVPTKKMQEPTAEEQVAAELVRAAREQGLSLTGPDGLLKQLTRTVLETALREELTALGPQLAQLCGLITGHARPLAGIDLGLTDPFAQRLR